MTPDAPLVVEVTLADARAGRPRSCVECAIVKALHRQPWVKWATVYGDEHAASVEIVSSNDRVIWLWLPAGVVAWIDWYDSLPLYASRRAIVPCVMPLPFPVLTIPALSDPAWEGVAA